MMDQNISILINLKEGPITFTYYLLPLKIWIKIRDTMFAKQTLGAVYYVSSHKLH